MSKFMEVDRFYIAAYKPADGGEKVNIEKRSGAFPLHKDRKDWRSSDIDWKKLERWYDRNMGGVKAIGMVIALVNGDRISYGR